jgi:hypothetical protein
MHHRSLIGLLCAALAFPAFAAEGGASGAEPSNLPAHTKRQDEAEVVCKRQRVAGSHIPREVCRTRTQLRQEQDSSDRRIQEMRRAPILNRPRAQ